MRLFDVAGPNACRQSIVGTVGARDDFLHISEGDHAHDGPEDFFPGDRHVVLYVGEDGWLDEVATVSNTLASAGKCCPLTPSRFDITHDSIKLGCVYLRTLVGPGIEWISYPTSPGPRHAFFYELIVNLLFYEDPRTRATGLALVYEKPEVRSFNCFIQIGVLKD